MFNSVRSRLTLWHTVVFTIVLVVFATAIYIFFAGVIRQRNDNSLAETTEAFANFLLIEYKEAGEKSFDGAAIEAINEYYFKDHRFIVLDDDLRIIAEAQKPPMKEAERQPVWSPALDPLLIDYLKKSSPTDRIFVTLHGDEEGTRVFIMPQHVGDHRYFVGLMRSLHDQEELLEEVQHALLVILPVVLALVSLGGYFLVRKTLAPVIDMSAQAARISAANLHERLHVTNEHDELGRLASVFNDLLARLDSSFEFQRRFMADASHELRTPVAIVRGEAEVALSQSRNPNEYRESLSVVQDEGKRLTRIVEDLFMLARADAGQHPLVLTDFYLDELISDCVRSVRTLATKRGLEIKCDTPMEMPFYGDEGLIRRMIMNLLDNAIKYTTEGGLIYVSGTRQGAEYKVSVKDTGPGIPKEAQPHIFERFYRLDKARARYENGGAGLGLSIAQWIAEAHNGRLELSNSDNYGSTFLASFPISEKNSS